VGQLEQHGIDTVHIVGPEPDTGEGYEIESKEDLPDMDPYFFFVFIWTDPFPELINDEPDPVQPAPYDEFHIRAMP
jgi:hypothetical protein